MSQERRAHPRFAVDLEANVATPGGMTFDARTIDISFAGICVTTAAAVLPGKDVVFSLKLLLESVEADSLEVPGHVVWCTPSEGQYQLGAAFRDGDFSPSARSGLEVLLKFLSGELEVPAQPEG